MARNSLEDAWRRRSQRAKLKGRLVGGAPQTAWSAQVCSRLFDNMHDGAQWTCMPLAAIVSYW